MPVLVGGHLCQSENGVLTGQAVVVRLLAAVLAARGPAVLARGELLETGRLDRVELLVLPPVRHHLVRVGADELALQAVEVGRLVLSRAWATKRRGDVSGGAPALGWRMYKQPAGLMWN